MSGDDCGWHRVVAEPLRQHPLFQGCLEGSACQRQPYALPSGPNLDQLFITGGLDAAAGPGGLFLVDFKFKGPVIRFQLRL